MASRSDLHAPLFTDTFTFCEWTTARFSRDPTPLARAVSGNALRLLEAITLALKDRAREVRIEEADERLITLRVQLRLAARTSLIDDAQMLFALESLDRIGRQLGGWQKSLGPA